MPRYPKLLAYAQLMRLPNVFTAFADICMAGAVSGAITKNPTGFGWILACSGCLYLGGMVWNDVFDRYEDARTQPFRPIPSGRVPTRVAVLFGIGLFLFGFVSAYFASRSLFAEPMLSLPVLITGKLMIAILLYDTWLKWTVVGPIAMGSCRFLNVILGLSVADIAGPDRPFALHLAGIIGVYIVGVTWFARTEETDSNRRSLLLASGVMALSLVAALLLPLHRPAGATPWYFPYLVVLFGFHIGIAIATAIQRRDPKSVQAAVKRCILGLVLLDAVLATAFVGWPGLLIVLLLLPARFLGKWVYST